MGASIEDVNLIIIHNGQKTYWSGMKSCGHVLLDLRFGLYLEDPKPDLSWISNTPWDEMLQLLDAPLGEPCYGSLTIDFDRKMIIDDSGGSSPFVLYPQWLAMTWDDPRDAPVNKKSLVEHLAKQRVKLGTLCRQGGEDNVVALDGKYKAAISQVNEVRYSGGATIYFDMPNGWGLEGVK
jgi:hypothetical protein